MRTNKEIYILMSIYLLGLVVLMFFASGCNVHDLALKKRQWIERKDKQVLTAYCASISRRDTVILKGKDSIIHNYIDVAPDSLISLIDSIKNSHQKITKTIRVKCPDIRVSLPDTVKVSIIDTSGMGTLRAELYSAQKQNNTSEGKYKGMRVWAYVGWGLSILLGIIIGILIKIKW